MTSMDTYRTPLIAVALTILTIGTACGSGNGKAALIVPRSVPSGLVPDKIEGNLTINEYLPGRKAFASAGASSLVADGQVWAIRRGETLVGTLQISTVKNDVSLTKASDRKAIIDGVMTGVAYQTIDVGSLQIQASTAADKTLYLWFGSDLFEVLQLKGSKVDPDTVAADIIDFQQSTGKLPA
jgi:hypothetical protein